MAKGIDRSEDLAAKGDIDRSEDLVGKARGYRQIRRSGDKSRRDIDRSGDLAATRRGYRQIRRSDGNKDRIPTDPGIWRQKQRNITKSRDLATKGKGIDKSEDLAVKGDIDKSEDKTPHLTLARAQRCWRESLI